MISDKRGYRGWSSLHTLDESKSIPIINISGCIYIIIHILTLITEKELQGKYNQSFVFRSRYLSNYQTFQVSIKSNLNHPFTILVFPRFMTFDKFYSQYRWTFYLVRFAIQLSYHKFTRNTITEKVKKAMIHFWIIEFYNSKV